MTRPGSDEKDSVFIAVLTSYERSSWPCPHLMESLLQVYGGPHFAIASQVYNYRPISVARNEAVRRFLDSGLDWLMMCDNDVAPPANALDVLDITEPRHSIIVLPCTIWNPGSDHPILNVWGGPDGTTPISELAPEFRRIAVGGSGCILISRRVLETMQPPYFREVSNGRTPTEDIDFCQRATQAGFEVWAHGGYRCLHFETVDLGLISDTIATARGQQEHRCR